MKFSETFPRALMCLVVISLISCKQEVFQTEWTRELAPPSFVARFETTKGNFDVKVKLELSPKAATRFYQLVKHGYFNNGIFYRVVPGFVAQFGNTDTIEMNRWRQFIIEDEEVKLNNTRGTISFASAGQNSRDLELFINLSDNTQLDTINIGGVHGFPAFGKVISGMDVVDKLYSGYGEATMSDADLYVNRPVFYQKFPKLDLIKKAYLLED